RHTEAERGAAHHRLVAQREQLDAEEARAREAAQRVRQLIAQAEADQEREKLLEHDAGSALADLGKEAGNLNAANDSAAEDLAAAERLSAEMSETLAETERLLERLTAELAEWNAKPKPPAAAGKRPAPRPRPRAPSSPMRKPPRPRPANRWRPPNAKSSAC